MKMEDDREWFEGTDRNSFAAAAVKAVENAEKVFDERGEDRPSLYDVRLQVMAEGPLSGYGVLVAKAGG
jgi:hypothetical protein